MAMFVFRIASLLDAARAAEKKDREKRKQRSTIMHDRYFCQCILLQLCTKCCRRTVLHSLDIPRTILARPELRAQAAGAVVQRLVKVGVAIGAEHVPAVGTLEAERLRPVGEEDVGIVVAPRHRPRPR